MGTYVKLNIWQHYEQIINFPTRICLSCDNRKAFEVTANYSQWNIVIMLENRLLTNTQLGCVVVGGSCLLLLFLNCELEVELMDINFTTMYYFILLYTNYLQL